MKLSGHSFGTWMARCLLLLPVALIVGCIAHYGVNVPFADDWDLSSLVSKSLHHKLQVRYLLQQHNEHRIFFLKLVVAAQAWLPAWDLRLQMFLSVVLCSLTALNIVILINRTLFLSRSAGLAAGFGMTCLLFSPVQYENWLWGFQCAFFVPPLCLTTAWVLLTSNLGRGSKFGLSVLLTTVASFSFSTGAFGWLLSYPLFLIATERSDRAALIRWLLYWFGAAGLCMGAYLIRYHQPVHSTRILTGFHPLAYAEYALVFLGGSLFRTATDQSTVVPFVTGLTLVILYLAALVYIFRNRHSGDLAGRSMPWAAFGAFAIGGAVLCAVGRRPYMPAGQALESRYTTVSLMLLISLVGLGIGVSRDFKASRKTRTAQGLPWIGAIAVAILTVGYLVNLPFSFRQMATLRIYHLDGKAALEYCRALRDPGMAEAIMTATLYPSIDAIRGFVQLLDEVDRFRPRLVKDSRMRDDNYPAGANRGDYGRLESVDVAGGEYTLSGWAILPGRQERADGIVLAALDSSGTWIALTMAGERIDRSDIKKTISPSVPANIGWRATFPATLLPPGAREVGAWAIDATTGRSYKLEGPQPSTGRR